MKYIQFWEYDLADLDKIVELGDQVRADREQHPEKWPTTLFPGHNMGGRQKGFSVVEATPEQMAYAVLKRAPLLRFTYIPIIESTLTVAIYRKMKQ